MVWVLGGMAAGGLCLWLVVVTRRQQRIRAELERVDSRMRALGVVHEVFEHATRPQPDRARHLRSIKALVPVAVAASVLRLLRGHPVAMASAGAAGVALSVAMAPMPQVSPRNPDSGVVGRPPAAAAETLPPRPAGAPPRPTTTVSSTTTSTSTTTEPVVAAVPPPTAATTTVPPATTTTATVPPLVSTTVLPPQCRVTDLDVPGIVDACL